MNATTSGVGSIHVIDADVPKSYPNDEGFSSYYRFNGTSDYIRIPTLPTQTQTTWSVWAKREGTGWNMLLGSQNTGAELRFNNNRPEIIWNNTSGSVLSSSTIDSNWHHYAVTAIQGEIKLYVDGILVGVDNTFNYASQINIDIGKRYNDTATTSYFFPGFIRDVRVYDRVLTPDEIAFLYNASGSNPGTANLLVHYPLTENALDASGNERNGTVFGPVLNYVPAATATLDALGGTLTHTGEAPLPGLAKGYAWQCDGSTVSVLTGQNPVPATDAFTITTWVYLDAIDEDRDGIWQQIGSNVNHKISLLANLAAGGFSLFCRFTNNSTLSVTAPLGAVVGWNKVTVSRVGSTFTLSVNGTTTSGTNSGSLPVDGNFRIALVDSDYSSVSIGPVTITTGGVTTTYSPVPGTRNVAVTKSDGTYSVITNAVVNGTLASLYTLGDGSWRLPEIENGAHWDGTGLYPAAPGASVAANGNAINIPANKHPRGILVDRTGGIIAPIDYEMGNR